jgi:23S rRNA (guanine745-N1)-methyltransferase
LQPGDTAEQVRSRRAFLEGGFYAPIANALCALASDHSCTGPILDVGCGEGYYSAQLAEHLNTELVGLDISKEAVRCAAAKYKDPLWLCATASHIPVADGSAQLITSLFALTMEEEFHRILAPGGYYFQVLAAQDHLLGLKSIIYPELKLREKDSVPQLRGFDLLQSVPISFTFTVQGQQVQNLFSMTPHVFRIGKEGAQRLARTEILTDTASCILNIYRRVDTAK